MLKANSIFQIHDFNLQTLRNVYGPQGLNIDFIRSRHPSFTSISK